MIADLPCMVKGSKKHCYKCGPQCQQCQARSQMICSSCPNQFCLTHDTGCSLKYVSSLKSSQKMLNLINSIIVRLVQYWRSKRCVTRLLKDSWPGLSHAVAQSRLKDTKIANRMPIIENQAANFPHVDLVATVDIPPPDILNTTLLVKRLQRIIYFGRQELCLK